MDSPLPMKRRLGKINILEAIVSGPDATEIFRQLGFVPWNCQHIESTKSFSMMGSSPLFAEMNDGEPAPEYEIAINEVFPESEGLDRVIQVMVRRQPPAFMLIDGGKKRGH